MSDHTLKARVGKRQPFDSAAQEAHLNMMRTASELTGPFHALFKRHNLTEASYNTLRILRGHHRLDNKHGLRASKIGQQMVVRVPDVTRIVDRLVTMGLAERCSCEHDRRVVYVAITPAGLELLEGLDGPVLQLHEQTLGHLTEAELKQLTLLLERAREGVEQPPSLDESR